MSDINQYLSFTLDDEQYAVSVLKVREVLEYTRITKIPGSSGYMRGVINLRGSGVPVIDLRTKFGLPEKEITKSTSIIVLEVHSGEELIVVGALSDSVQEVIDLNPEQIEKAPRFGTKLSTDYILGMGKRDDHFIIILDIDKIFSTDEVSKLSDINTERVAEEESIEEPVST